MSPHRSELIEGELVLGHIRGALPMALRPWWRYSLAIMFPVCGALLLVLNPATAYDYAKVLGVAMAVYIICLSVQIVRVNWQFRSARNSPYGQTMPLHIMLLALGTIQYSIYLSYSFVNTLGQAPATPAIPFLIDFAHLTVIFGLNYVWRFVLLRDNDSRGNI